MMCTVYREKKQHERKLKNIEKKDLLNNLKSESNKASFGCERCDVVTETKLH